MKTRILAMLLVLVMVIGMLPGAALVAEEGATEVATAEALIDAVAAGGSIKLSEDIVLPGAGLVVNKNVTLDLNGKNISAPNDTMGDGIFHVTSDATLTINGEGTVNAVNPTEWDMAIWADGGHAVINGGTYTNEGAGAYVQYDLIYAKNGGTVTINGGTFECQTPTWTLNVNNASNSSEIIVKGGSFKNFDPAAAMTDDTIPEGGENPVDYVPGGYKSVKDGDYYVVSSNHEAKIGDTLYATLAEAVGAATAGNTVKLLKDVTVVPSNEAPCVLLPNGVTLDLNGKTLTGNVQGTVAMNGGKLITIDPRKAPAEMLMKMIAAEGADFAYLSEDGVFDIKLYKVVDGAFAVEGGNLAPDRALTFVSGSVTLNGDEWRTDTDQIVTLKKEASLNIPTGKTFLIQTGTKVVIEDPAKVTIGGTVVAAAKIGNNYYGDLATAIADAEASDTVVLVTDIVLDGAIYVDSTVAVDLAGCDISMSAKDTVGDGVFCVTKDGKLTLDDTVGGAVVNGASAGNGYDMTLWANGGEIIINGGTYNNLGADGTESDKDPTPRSDMIYAGSSKGAGGTITINGGYFESEAGARRYVLNKNNTNGTIIVKGGSFKAYNPTNGDDAVPGPFVAPGYKSVDNGDGTFSVEEDIVIATNGVYPYGQAMTTSGLTLHIPVEGQKYQWQSSTSEDGTYTDISTDEALTLSNPTSGTWYRCVVDGEASKAVRVVKASTSGDVDGRTWTRPYEYSDYYISNGTMAYCVGNNKFDVTGLYEKDGYSYMLQTVFGGGGWEMHSSDSAQPNPPSDKYYSTAQLDALRVSFDEDPYTVLFEADLASGQQSFSFGSDTQLGNGNTSGSFADYAALVGTVKDSSLQQVAMIGAASEKAAQGTDPAFVIAPDSTTPANGFWLGSYGSRVHYAYNTDPDTHYGCYSYETISDTRVVTRVEAIEDYKVDTGMTMSWLNVPSGGVVKFVFKVGDVASTGAVPSASVELTSKTITIKDTENTLFYKILDENGNPLAGITFEDETGNALTPNADGYVQGNGGNIIIKGLKQSTSYKVITVAKNDEGVLDEQNKAVEEVVTPINPEMTVNPESGVETKINCVATGNSLTFSGLNNTYYYFLETADGYVIDAPASPTNGELAFTDLPAGYKLYLGAVSEDNEYYDPVEYSTNPVVVTYDANGGENAPAAHTLSGERQYLAWQEPTLVCHNFLGWAKSSTATSPDCDPEFPCLPGDTTLYAVWGLGVHSWATDWSSDNTNHWHECTRDGCDAIDNKEEHHYTDGYCECGKAEPVSSDDSDYTPAVDIPVSNDENSVDVKAEVSGKDATIKPLSDKQIEQIVGDENASGDVVVDLSDLGKTIDTAGIPKKTLEAIVDAAEDAGNDTEHLVIKLSTAELKLDDTAMRAIVDQAKGDTIKFNFDDVGLGRLNKAQKEAVKDMDIRKGYEAYITVNGKRISDFKGGNVEIIVPYAVPAGESVAGFSVWYIDEDGNPEKQKSSYDGKHKWFVVSHFSDYVIAYDKNEADVTNCPKDASCPIHAFPDTNKQEWYHDGVHYCIENGLMNGISADQFAPNVTTSRAMVVTLLWRMEGSPLVKAAEGFNDVFDSDWYYNAIRWATVAGIVEGYEGYFNPNDSITREQMATILWRYCKYKGIDVSIGENTNILSYEDAFDVSSWAMDAMQWACGSGMIQGIAKNGTMYLDPQGYAVRCQSATMIYRFCTEIIK